MNLRFGLRSVDFEVDIVLVEVGVCFGICNKSQTRCCEGMRSCLTV